MRKLYFAGTTLILATAVAAIAPGSASALTGGTPASGEAPWAVKIQFLGRPKTMSCSGQYVTRTLILTAAHCVYPDAQRSCGGALGGVPNFAVRRSDRPRPLLVRAPAAVVHPNFSFCVSANYPQNDVAFLRTSVPAPATVPIAAPAEIDSFRGRGVTLFAAGRRSVGGTWRYPKLARKSRDGAWFGSRLCLPGAAPTAMCFDRRSRVSRTEGGDSGGAWVGWQGRWTLLAVHQGAGNPAPAYGTSLATPSVRNWVDGMIAANP